MIPKWKQFENIVADIQRSLTTGASVTQNAKIRGKNSGVLREVDICIRQRVAQFEILIAISCKDHAAPLDVTEVESFAGSLEDIGANKGAMVAANGFSEAAKALAKQKGIDLYRFVDTDHIEWASYVSVPTLVRNLHLEWRAVFEGSREALSGTHQDHDTILHREDGAPLGSVRELVMKLWKTGVISESPGEHHLPSVFPEATFVRVGDQYVPVSVRIDALVSYQWFFGALSLATMRGLTNEIDGSLKIQRMITDWLRFEDLQKWQLIDRPEDLAVKPVLTVLVKDAPAGDPDAVRSIRLTLDDSRSTAT